MMTSKLRLLLRVLASNPTEFVDRLRAIVEVKRDRLRAAPAYPAAGWEELVVQLTREFGVDASALDREIDQQQLPQSVRAGIAALGDAPAFALRHNADQRIARLCYIACRAMQPNLVVETGVAYGVTTTFVLKALALNGRGHLHSIDLPPLGEAADALVGRLVPASLRSRWTLHRGASRRVLPALLTKAGMVDLFIHDSLHTLGNMREEFAQAYGHRADPFLLIADDIELNAAFEEFTREARPAFQAVMAADTKAGRSGICLFRSAGSRA